MAISNVRAHTKGILTISKLKIQMLQVNKAVLSKAFVASIVRDNSAEPRVLRKSLNIEETFFGGWRLCKSVVETYSRKWNKQDLDFSNSIFRTLGGTKFKKLTFHNLSFRTFNNWEKTFLGKIFTIQEFGFGTVILSIVMME